MMELPVSPVVGGLVITERAWKRIPEKYRDDLKASIEKVAKDFAMEAAKTNGQAMSVMELTSVNQVLHVTLKRIVKIFQEGVLVISSMEQKRGIVFHASLVQIVPMEQSVIKIINVNQLITLNSV